MPNWTKNKVSVWFKAKRSAEAFVEKHFEKTPDGACFDYGTIIPQPTKPDGLPGAYLDPGKSHAEAERDRPWFDWYRWNLDFWGVKWNACETNLNGPFRSGGGYSVDFSFSSPWGPPIRVMRKLFAMHRGGKFAYEWSMPYADCSGGMKAEGGKVICEYTPE